MDTFNFILKSVKAVSGDNFIGMDQFMNGGLTKVKLEGLFFLVLILNS